jgi:hypothetical protein
MNDVLRRALVSAGLEEADVARRLDVDPKTVRRWLDGRIPYPRHRAHLAALTQLDERDLWSAVDAHRPPSTGRDSGVLATYPHRSAVPREAWEQLFGSAEREIGILVYAGLFLSEDVGILRTLADKARTGVPVRILLGDPDGPHVGERGADEGVGDALAAKIRNALVFYRPLSRIDGVEIRLHRTTLYASIYRADDELLVNPHIYSVAASQSPVLHLRKTKDVDMASTYLDSLERVWANATLLT